MSLIFIFGVLAIIATFINLLYSYYERIESFFWNWPAYGFIAVGMFLNHAYANALMQISMALISTYGYFVWTRYRKQSLKEALLSLVYDRNAQHHEVSVIATTRMTLKQHSVAVLSVLGIAAVVWWFLRFVDHIAPIVDAVSFAIPVVGAVLFNHKKIETWVYYIVADCFSFSLAYKAGNVYNMITMGLLAVFCGFCLWRWSRFMKK